MAEHPITQERLTRWAKAGSGVIIGTAAMTAAWLSMGWPVPATTAYVASELTPRDERVSDLEGYAQSTRMITLSMQQSLLLEEIIRLEGERERAEGVDARHLDTLIRIKERQAEQVGKQIDKIERALDGKQ